jgi:hypothetical protein
LSDRVSEDDKDYRRESENAEPDQSQIAYCYGWCEDVQTIDETTCCGSKKWERSVVPRVATVARLRAQASEWSVGRSSCRQTT